MAYIKPSANDDPKQAIIVRQSSLKWLIEWSNTCGYCLDLKDALSISEVITSYCLNGYSKELSDRAIKVQDYLDGRKNAKELLGK